MRSPNRIGLALLFFVQWSLSGFAQSGIITTVAGTGTAGYSGDGGPATSAQLANPTSVAVDTAGNLFITDMHNNRVRKVTPGGVISTVAGNGTKGFSGDGGTATAAQLNFPTGVAVDRAGNLYIADWMNYRVRKVTPDGVISTVAGNGTWGFSGDGGPATSAQLNWPYGVAVDAAGNLFIADDGNSRIRKVTPGGVISTVAGNGTGGFSGDGGPATSASLSSPYGVAVDTAGNLYIVDSGNNRIRKVTLSGVISTVAGNGTSGYSGDGGSATSASLSSPYGVAVDTAGNLFIADSANQRIRKVTPAGVISTVAGNGPQGYSGDGGPATSASLSYPEGVAVDTAGNLFIADTDNDCVRRVGATQTLPNLTPYQPSGWSDKIVVSKILGLTTDSSPLYPTDTLYVDWAVTNNGSVATAATFYTDLFVDGTRVEQWHSDPPLNPGYYVYVQDYSIGTLSVGTHTIEIVADSTNVIAESNENDNVYTKTITVIPLTTVSLPGSGGITETSLGRGSLVTAYGQIITTTPTQPAALAIFGITQNGFLTTEAGVAASTPNTAARIFVDYNTANGTDSGVAVVNPSNSAITLNVQLNNAQGIVTTCPNQTVPANGHVAMFASQLCPNIPNPFVGTLTLTSSAPFAATTLQMGENSHGEVLYNSLPVATPNAPPAGNSLYFSQFADGGGCSTEILLMNLTATSIAGTVAFFDNNGHPVTMNFGPSIGSTSTLNYSIPGNGMLKFTTTGSTPGTPLQSGAVVVTSTAGSLPSGAVVFSIYNGTGGLVSQAGVLNSPLTTSSRMYVDKSNSSLFFDTGVAIVNPSSSTATIQLNLVSLDGSFTASKTLTLATDNHIAAFIDQSALMGSAASSIPSNFQGVLTLSSNVPIAPVTLRLTINQRGDDLYSTLPVVDLNNPPTGPQYLPQIADGGGYTTQIILINTSPSSGNVTMNFFNASGGSVQIAFANTNINAVTVTPSSATINVGQTQQFSAAATDANGNALAGKIFTWASSKTSVATVDNTGKATAVAAGTTTISAASEGITGAATLAVTAVSSVAITISPTSATVQTGATQQFTATVTGTTNTAVTWSVNGIIGGNTTVGTISGSGLYTAPSTVPSTNPVTVKATSVADTTKSASATVTITAPSVAVSISPNSATVQTGATQQFTATVTGTTNTAVTWSVAGVQGGNSTVGAISTTGLYTAPSSVPSTNPVTVTATSVADPTKSASATVKITSATGTSAVTLSTNSVSFGNQALQTMSPAQTILVTSSGTGPLAISSVAVSGTNSADFLQFNNCPGSAGVLSAGATCFINVMFNPSKTTGESATLTIADNASGSSQTVGLSGQGVGQAVTITPTATTVEINHSVPFIQNVAGLSDTGVTWKVTAGTISAGGLYTAPASIPTPNTVTVTVTSQSDPNLSASAIVTIIPTAVSVLVSPTSASVRAGGSEVVTAVVVDTSNTTVTWSVNGVANGNSAVGTIVASGVGGNVATYTAPATPPSTNPVIITATSAADPTKSDSASIIITSGSGIVITSLDKTSLQPFNLLTISGAGFNPQATVTVNFSDSTGYSVNVPPVSVGASSVVVGVPPYISVSSGDFAAGSVNIQVSQTLGSTTVTSNTFSGFQIPNLPTLYTQPGAVTLALLTAHQQFAQFLITYFSQVDPTSSLNTPEMNGALNVLASGLSPLISEISDVVQNPTHTFTLGVASGNTLTVGSSELAKADKMIVEMLSAQAAAGYVDGPEPSCQIGGGAGAAYDAELSNWNEGSAFPVTPNADEAQLACLGPAVTMSLKLVGGSAAVATGTGELIFGSEAMAMASAAISSQLAYITSTLGGGMILVGGALGQGSAHGKTLVQAGMKIISDYLKDAVKSTILSKTFSNHEDLYNMTVIANELVHASEAAPPYKSGPSAGPTSTLTVSTTGAGTIVSFPGGVVCGGPDSTACVVPFLTGETVYLASESATGSSFSGFSGACSGSTCQVTMSSDQTVSATFTISAGLPGMGSCSSLTVTPVSLTLDTSVNKTAILQATLASGSGPFYFISSNTSVATVDYYDGTVTAVGSGTALISVSSPNAPCQAVVAVIVNSAEIYTGTVNFSVTVAAPNDPCTPNPLITTGLETGVAVQFAVSPSLLNAGAFSAVATIGAGTETVKIPAVSCPNPDGSTDVIPGSSTSMPVPASSGGLTGTSDGHLITIPEPGFSPITGTVSVLGSTVQLILNWSDSISESGFTIQMQYSMNLTKQ